MLRDGTLISMYVGVDIGGTKTFAAVLDENGVITEQIRIPTSKDYEEFLSNLSQAVSKLKCKKFSSGGSGIPATKIDRKNGIALAFGNLPWKNVPIQTDLEKICQCPIAVENDAKLGALSEYMLLKDKYASVLYVTVSTGIGYGLVVDGVIDTSVGDGGGRTIMLDNQGKLEPWEDFASGKAILEHYGKPAKDIEDENIWKAISRDLAKGFIHLIAVMQPEVIVIGGGVGNYFNRFGKFLEEDIKKSEMPLVKLPVLMEAQRPEEAVIYGCYDIAKQVYPNAKDNQ